MDAISELFPKTRATFFLNIIAMNVIANKSHNFLSRKLERGVTNFCQEKQLISQRLA